MFSYIAIIFCIVVMVYALLKYKCIYQPIIIFNFFWAFILFLEMFHLYGLYKSDDRIYGYILAGLMSFNVGFFLWNYRRKRIKTLFKMNKYSTKKIKYFSYEPRYIMLYLLAILGVMYYSKSAITSFCYLLVGANLGDIRSLVQDSTSIYNSAGRLKIFNAISILLIIPSSYVIQVTGVMDFWFGKRGKKLFILAVILTILSSIGEGGRTNLVNLCIYMVLGYFLSGSKLEKNFQMTIAKKKERKRFFVVSLISGIAFLFWFTVSRTGHTIFKNLYLYFSMQPYMFNLWSEKVDIEEIIGYGEASLNGFSFAVLYVIKNIIGINFPVHWKKVYDLIRATDSEWQIITSISTKANAYVGSFWFFYVDGRIYGIILGMFFYGVYLAHIFNDAIKYTNIKVVTLYGFIYQGLAWSFIRFPFSNLYYAIAFLMLNFIVFKSGEREV